MCLAQLIQVLEGIEEEQIHRSLDLRRHQQPGLGRQEWALKIKQEVVNLGNQINATPREPIDLTTAGSIRIAIADMWQFVQLTGSRLMWSSTTSISSWSWKAGTLALVTALMLMVWSESASLYAGESGGELGRRKSDTEPQSWEGPAYQMVQ